MSVVFGSDEAKRIVERDKTFVKETSEAGTRLPEIEDELSDLEIERDDLRFDLEEIEDKIRKLEEEQKRLLKALCR